MGQSLSQEQVQAHLARQEALIRQLQTVVDRQAAELEKITASAGAVGDNEEFSGNVIDAADIIDDELAGLEAKVFKAERRKVGEDAVSGEEKELPPEEWVEPTEEEERGFQATKPWLGAMAKPTGFEYGKTDDKPNIDLELEHVYGYRANEVRSNIAWIDEDTIVYPAAGVGIVHNLKTNTQKFFRGHTDDIVCLAYHPARRLVATGEQGKYPGIYVWDVDSCKQVSKMAGLHRRAVVSVAFSKDGSRVASVGLDDDHSVAIYDWATGSCLASEKGDTNRILDIQCNLTTDADNNNDFVTVGVKHIKFWSLDGSKLNETKGLLGRKGDRQPFLTVTTTSRYTVAGTQGGELYCFSGRKLAKIVDAHQKCVYSIKADGDTLYSAGRDGYVSCWNMNTLKRTQTVNLNKHEDPEVLKAGTNAVRAIDFFGREEPIIIAGCLAGTISKVGMTKGTVEVVVNAHSGDLQKKRNYGELWGLTTSPNSQLFASAGEDRTLRIWNAKTRTMVRKIMLTARAQSVAWSPDGKWLAVGLQDGRFMVVDEKFNDVISIKKTRRRVQCLRFSPDSTQLAVGSADNTINVYDATKEFQHLGKCTGNSSVILHIDYSEDGSVIQSCSQSYELLFYSAKDFSQITRSRELKDTNWATFTSILGWNVQGIWPKESDGSDVNAVSKSHSGKYLASGEDTGLVKVFQYPCVGGGLNRQGLLTKRPESVRQTGHSEHVTEVQWLTGDSHLLSAGGGDLSIFQWKVVPAS